MSPQNPKPLAAEGLRKEPAAFLPPLPVPNLPQSLIIASIAPFFCRSGAAEAAGQFQVDKEAESESRSGQEARSST